jgi:hypothetical protein
MRLIGSRLMLWDARNVSDRAESAFVRAMGDAAAARAALAELLDAIQREETAVSAALADFEHFDALDHFALRQGLARRRVDAAYASELLAMTASVAGSGAQGIAAGTSCGDLVSATGFCADHDPKMLAEAVRDRG